MSTVIVLTNRHVGPKSVRLDESFTDGNSKRAPEIRKLQLALIVDQQVGSCAAGDGASLEQQRI